MSTPADPRRAAEAERAAEARRILAGVERESGGVMHSHLARAADHFAGRDAPAEDRIEVWGRRIGRGLAVIAFVALAIHLLTTYGLR